MSNKRPSLLSVMLLAFLKSGLVQVLGFYLIMHFMIGHIVGIADYQHYFFIGAICFSTVMFVVFALRQLKDWE